MRVVTHLRSVACHYGITQCYLHPDTSEHTPPSPQPDGLVLVLDLPTFKDGGLSKPRPMVQRATGPWLLRDIRVIILNLSSSSSSFIIITVIIR